MFINTTLHSGKGLFDRLGRAARLCHDGRVSVLVRRGKLRGISKWVPGGVEASVGSLAMVRNKIERSSCTQPHIRREKVHAGLHKRRHQGFTLVEILVVLAISVGLVALMAGLYRTVAQSALSLRSGQQEWLLQRQLREQLPRLFSVNNSPLHSVNGRSTELYLASWQSRENFNEGKPVIACYRYDERERALYYYEQTLPSWWGNAAAMYNPERLQSDLRHSEPYKLVTGIAELEMLYLPMDAADTRPERWLSEWVGERPPKLIQLRFNKAGKSYSIWFETRVIDA